jgi:hypothetical protein
MGKGRGQPFAREEWRRSSWRAFELRPEPCVSVHQMLRGMVGGARGVLHGEFGPALVQAVTNLSPAFLPTCLSRAGPSFL